MLNSWEDVEAIKKYKAEDARNKAIYDYKCGHRIDNDDFGSECREIINTFRAEEENEQSLTNIYLLVGGSEKEAVERSAYSQRVMKETLYASYVLSISNKNSARTVATIMFGDNKKDPETYIPSSTFKSPEDFLYENLTKDHRSKNILDNEIDALSDLMKKQGRNQKADVMIMTGGHLSSIKRAAEKLTALKAKYPKVNISIYNHGPKSNNMQKLAKRLEKNGVAVHYDDNFSRRDLRCDIIENVGYPKNFTRPVSKEQTQMEINAFTIKEALGEGSTSLQGRFTEVSKKLEKLKQGNQQKIQSRKDKRWHRKNNSKKM